MWARDWLTSQNVRAMSSVRRGVFIDLICVDWDGDGIPDDDAACLAYCARDASAEDVAAVLGQFDERHPETNRRTHRKANEERARNSVRSSIQRDRANKRWDATAMPRHNSGNATVMPGVCGNDAPNPYPNPNELKKNDITLVPASGSADRKDAPEVIPFGLFGEEATASAGPSPESVESAKESQRDPIPSATSPAGTCPHKEIAKLWNDVMADSPISDVKVMTPARETALRGLWAFWEGDKAERMESCRCLFARIKASEFCCGSTGWTADFDWAIKPASRAKIIEGKYDNRAKPAPQKHFRK